MREIASGGTAPCRTWGLAAAAVPLSLAHRSESGEARALSWVHERLSEMHLSESGLSCVRVLELGRNLLRIGRPQNETQASGATFETPGIRVGVSSPIDSSTSSKAISRMLRVSSGDAEEYLRNAANTPRLSDLRASLTR